MICSIVRGGTFAVSLRGDATAGTEERGARDSSPRTNTKQTILPDDFGRQGDAVTICWRCTA